MTLPSVLPETLLRPDETAAFVRALFDGLTGWVDFRAIQEPAPTGTPAHTWDAWCEIGPGLAAFAINFAHECDINGYGAFLIPAPVEQWGTGADHLLSLPWLPVDLDKGNVDAYLNELRECLGNPALLVYSGGITETGHRKAHAYYRLSKTIDAKIREAFAVQTPRYKSTPTKPPSALL